jgi:hypothetical protein
MPNKKFWVNLSLFFCCFTHIERFCHRQTEGFRLGHIASDLPYNPSWETSALIETQLLEQPFHFLGSGGQCYAFLSEDGTTVIKFFKHHHMRPDSWIQKEEKHKRLETLFTSCALADRALKEETGLIYTHLNPTSCFKKTLTLIDKIGVAHEIDLDHTTFVLQKRATLLYDTLLEAIDQHQMQKGKEIIDSLVHLLITRCKKGIADHDPHVKRNFAWLENRVIELDVGSFYPHPFLSDPAAYKPQIAHELRKLKSWLEVRCPELADFLSTKLEQL